MRGRAIGLLLVAFVLALAAVPSAGAGESDLTGVEFRELAEAAATGDGAREELERVERVDGRPVDLERALEGAEGASLRRRLETLAEGGEEAPAGTNARREAGAILEDRRYRGTDLPKPLAGVVDWIAERLGPFRDAFDAVAARIPGGRSALWTIISGFVVALAALVAWTVSRRGVPGAAAGGFVRMSADLDSDPAGLERMADEAERAGDLEQALRLRFRAGLLRLHRAKVIALRESLTTREVDRKSVV